MASSRSKPDSSAQPYTRSETTFNADLRAVLKARDLPGVLHVRETENPGAFDLWIPSPPAAGRKSGHRYMWMELKVFEPFSPSQKTFARERVGMGEFLCVVRLKQGFAFEIKDHFDERELVWGVDFRLFDWSTWVFRTLNEHYEFL